MKASVACVVCGTVGLATCMQVYKRNCISACQYWRLRTGVLVDTLSHYWEWQISAKHDEYTMSGRKIYMLGSRSVNNEVLSIVTRELNYMYHYTRCLAAARR